MTIVKGLLVVAAAYLIGSINGAILISKCFLGYDIRQHGSGNAGLTNAFRVMGKKMAGLVLLIDVAKGVVAALLGGWLLGPNGKLLAGIFAIVGHIFPVYFGFKGGKGVLTAAAAMVVCDWRALLACLTVFVIVVALTRYVSLGSMLGGVTLPTAQIILGREPFALAVGFAIAAALLYFHRGNIRRLASGTEPKFSWSGKKSGDIQKEK